MGYVRHIRTLSHISLEEANSNDILSIKRYSWKGYSEMLCITKQSICTCVLLSSKYKWNIAHVYQLKNNKILHGNILTIRRIKHSYNRHALHRRWQREGDQRFYFCVPLSDLSNIASENSHIHHFTLVSYAIRNTWR